MAVEKKVTDIRQEWSTYINRVGMEHPDIEDDEIRRRCIIEWKKTHNEGYQENKNSYWAPSQDERIHRIEQEVEKIEDISQETINRIMIHIVDDLCLSMFPKDSETTATLRWYRVKDRNPRVSDSDDSGREIEVTFGPRDWTFDEDGTSIGQGTSLV